ncbi:MAG: FG-GAP repeat domain-containing protein, partial [Flavobacteriaceae bacterium]
QVAGNLGIDYIHKEDSYIDFNRQKLMPFKHSDRGPGHALLDFNADGELDIIWGGSHHMPNKLFVWKDTSFVETPLPTSLRDSVIEVMEIAIADIDGNGGQDIFLGTGGSFFFNDMPPLLDQVLIQRNAALAPTAIPESYSNTSVVSAHDYDGDGDKDLFCGNLGITNDYGQIPTSHLYANQNGNLTSIPLPKQGKLGMLTDALWDDVDKDGTKDLIIIGEWMSPQVLYNRNGKLENPKPMMDGLNGLWQCLIAHDIDRDGDRDYILGNWGSNAKFKASKEHPMKMYYGDLDGNGQTETLVTIEKNGRYYPLENSMDILSQLQSLRKKYPNYADFAGKDIQEILGDAFEDAQVLEAQELRSGYLLNKEEGFEFHPFQNELQVSPIMALAEHDFDGDGENELLAAGNYFGVKPLQGRFDSFPGALIDGEKSVLLTNGLGLDLAQKSVRHLSILQSDGKEYLLVTVNNGAAIIYQIK